MLRDLLCVVNADDKESPALIQALALNSGYGISPAFIAAAPGAPHVSNAFGLGVVQDLVGAANESAATLTRQIENKILSAAKVQGFEPVVRKEVSSLAEIATSIEQSARCHDLTLMDRPDDFLDPVAGIFETVLFGSGRPVMLATPAKNPVQLFRTAALAWDGSGNAARALASATALFPDLEQIFVLTVVGEKDLSNLVPGAEIAAHIRRHGIEVTVACVDASETKGHAGVAIQEYASRKNADLLVMGGYRHSRLREFVLGGVTEYLTQTTVVPLLLAH
jgi:nucleotide-binding universal stress UspA family protein